MTKTQQMDAILYYTGDIHFVCLDTLIVVVVDVIAFGYGALPKTR